MFYLKEQRMYGKKKKNKKKIEIKPENRKQGKNREREKEKKEISFLDKLGLFVGLINVICISKL